MVTGLSPSADKRGDEVKAAPSSLDEPSSGGQ